MGYYSLPILHRFWSKIDRQEGRCWNWTGTKDSYGYGVIKVMKKNLKAHRFSYTILKGVIPEGLTIDHLCNNKSCVNPSHLEPVPAGVNVLRGLNQPAAINSRKTHCIYGHALSGDNLYVYSGGKRRACKMCHNRRGN